MIPPTQRLDQPTDQTPLHTEGDAPESRAIKGHGTVPGEIQQRHGGFGSLPLLSGPSTANGPLSLRRGHRHLSHGPQSGPLEAQVGVGRVVDPRNAFGLQGRRQPCAGHGQQGPQQADVGAFDQGRHAGEPVRPALPRCPHGHGLGLVVSLVCHQKVEDPSTAAGVPQQPVSCLTGGLLQAGHGFRPRPDENTALDPQPGQQIPGRCGFGPRLGTQPVIDDQGKHPSPTLARPAVGQQHETKRIPSARNGDGKVGSRFERPERRHQAREFCPVERDRAERCGGRPIAHPQPFF